MACGAALAAPEPAREARKVVTVVFADITGSTGLGERLDPEALRSIMGRWFDAMRAVLERHDGSVEKFIGDAVVAVFGVPVVHEDDALRAVRAAVGMQAALATLNETSAPSAVLEIAMRVGVNTGAVVVGDARAGGSRATGDAVNVAARLQQAAEPGETLLGESTWRLVRDAVTTGEPRAVEVKGRDEPVTVRRLLAVDQAAEAIQRHVGGADDRPRPRARHPARRVRARRRRGALRPRHRPGIGRRRQEPARPRVPRRRRARTPRSCAGAACRTARASPGIRSPSSSARPSGSTTRPSRPRSSTACAPGSRAPTTPTRSSRGWREPLGIATDAGPGRGAVLGDPSPSRAARASTVRSSSCSTTSTGPSRPCSISSITWPSGSMASRCSCSRWRDPSSSTSGPAGAAASRMRRRSCSNRCRRPRRSASSRRCWRARRSRRWRVERIAAAADGNPLYVEQVIEMLVDDGLRPARCRWLAGHRRPRDDLGAADDPGSPGGASRPAERRRAPDDRAGIRRRQGVRSARRVRADAGRRPRRRARSVDGPRPQGADPPRPTAGDRAATPIRSGTS